MSGNLSAHVSAESPSNIRDEYFYQGSILLPSQGLYEPISFRCVKIIFRPDPHHNCFVCLALISEFVNSKIKCQKWREVQINVFVSKFLLFIQHKETGQ